MHGVELQNRSIHFKELSVLQVKDLIQNVTVSEVSDAFWSCGSDKAPGPDGFNFAFYKALMVFIGERHYGGCS